MTSKLGSAAVIAGVVGSACGVAVCAPPSGVSVSPGVASSMDPFLAGESFEDDFDSYDLGEVCGMNGWEEWDGSVDVCAEVSDEQAQSMPNSLKLVGAEGGDAGLGDDTVRQVQIDEGQWTFSVMTYVPDDAEGAASVILLNTYPPTVNADWSVVVELDADLGLVELFTGEFTGLTTGEWVELRTEIDLEEDTVDYYYGGELFVDDKSWTGGIQPGGLPQIRAIDLYGGEPTGTGTTGTYIDDVMLVPAGGCPADCNGDGELSVLDFVCFQQEWQNQTAYGDCDGNGDYSVLDFVCYQQLFQAGCP